MFRAIGLPPNDMLEEVARAWAAAGHDVDAVLQAAASVTSDWEYTPTEHGRDPCREIMERLQPTCKKKRRVPLKLKTPAEILNPQPTTASVLHALLQWIDLADLASQRNQPRPSVERESGMPIFPEGAWWLTELEQRRSPNAADAMSDAEYDPEDLTNRPEEAAVWESDTSVSTGYESEASLPAGPPPHRVAVAAASPAAARVVSTEERKRESDNELPAGRRLRQKTAQVDVASPGVGTSRLHRALRPATQATSPASPQGLVEHVEMHTSAVPELPAHVRRAAKRGDPRVHVRSGE